MPSARYWPCKGAKRGRSGGNRNRNLAPYPNNGRDVLAVQAHNLSFPTATALLFRSACAVPGYLRMYCFECRQMRVKRGPKVVRLFSILHPSFGSSELLSQNSACLRLCKEHNAESGGENVLQICQAGHLIGVVQHVVLWLAIAMQMGAPFTIL